MQCLSCSHVQSDEDVSFEKKRWPRCRKCKSRKGWVHVKLLFDDLPDNPPTETKAQPFPYTFAPEERNGHNDH